MNGNGRQQNFLKRWTPLFIAPVVFILHALYIRHVTASASSGWADLGIEPVRLWGFGPYIDNQDYFLGFSYALSAGFIVWAITRCTFSRGTSVAGASGGIGLVALLAMGGCFLIGCCGSPMLPIYLALFGAKAFGVGKPIMAGITVVAIGCGYWCISRRSKAGACLDGCCK